MKQYRALIVDDEPIAIDSIEYIIKHSYNSIEIAGRARSGREAIEKAYAVRPDIVIMDINMPGINGLEAMRKIREANSNVRLIVASAFDYFDYAVEAVALSVDEYLLKPIKLERLVEALQKVTLRIDQTREQIRRELDLKEKFEMVAPVLETGFINAICMFDSSEQDLHAYTRLFDCEGRAGYVMTVEFGEKAGGEVYNKISESVRNHRLYISYRDILKSLCHCVVGPMMLNRIIVFVFDDASDDPFEQKLAATRLAQGFYAKAHSLYPDLSIGIGSRSGDIGQIKRSYHESLRALRLIDSRSFELPVVHVDDVMEERPEEGAGLDELFGHSVYAAVAAQDVSAALLAFDELLLDLCGGNPELETVKNKAVMLIAGFGRRYGSAVRSLSAVLSDIIAAGDIGSLRTVCRRYIEELTGQIASGRQKRVNAVIEKAERYLCENFDREIALEDIARAVNLSPFYFSRFYKEETGVNFIDRLTGIRMEKAKGLLLDNTLSIKDVARMVGYADPNYFSKLFKKMVGTTATEYKDIYGK
ncbi:MAG: response regulator [Acetanaerobacterium sp.]